MNRNDIENRLRELGIYSDFYYRKELKVLSGILKDGEQLNCIFTGVNDADRKMAAVTDSRIIIVFAGVLGSGEVKVIRRDAVRSYSFVKKLLFSKASIETSGEIIRFDNVEGGMKELFEWAMSRPLGST